MSLKCKLGFHEYKPNLKEFQVNCVRCGKINSMETLQKLNFELQSQLLYDMGVLDEEEYKQRQENRWENE